VAAQSCRHGKHCRDNGANLAGRFAGTVVPYRLQPKRFNEG
jgi:hypothetical protein